VYLTSFIHREDLFGITERWLWNRLEPGDGLRITQILICDGFVVSETLDTLAGLLLEMAYEGPFRHERIRFKGELREAICRHAGYKTPRTEELIGCYRGNPDFFYREAPINGVTCWDREGRLIGVYRIKRPKRIAEKANRYIANWIFTMVQECARKMAEKRAGELGIPVERLVTPPEEMAAEFIAAEGAIAEDFRRGTVALDRPSLTIHDIGGIKIIGDADRLSRLEKKLAKHPMIRRVDKERHWGDYQATSLILEIPWDRESICRRYTDRQEWKKHLNRGIPGEVLQKGLGPFWEGARPTLNIEVILSTFPDMVESELGRSIHEERIIAQRDNKVYQGYIPMNVELLIEYLFAVGLSPQNEIDLLPIKLWGRYLPDTIGFQIRKLYDVPEYGEF
jgi:hypothetical protein